MIAESLRVSTARLSVWIYSAPKRRAKMSSRWEYIGREKISPRHWKSRSDEVRVGNFCHKTWQKKNMQSTVLSGKKGGGLAASRKKLRISLPGEFFL